MNDKEIIENLDFLMDLDLLAESNDFQVIEELDDVEKMSNESEKESK
jgi:hypothetical protein